MTPTVTALRRYLVAVATSYDAAFFAALTEGSRRSADRIVPVVVDVIAPRSVIDVGCGTGEWLAAFRAAGIEDVLGLDGDYADRAQLHIPASAFEAVDLSQPLRIARRFDLAISLEVAEHLPPERGESFVADLAALAPVVLFSAAVPDQGGIDHIAERWQDEWAVLFARHGLRPLDVVRPVVWDDENVENWTPRTPFSTFLRTVLCVALTGRCVSSIRDSSGCEWSWRGTQSRRRCANSCRTCARLQLRPPSGTSGDAARFLRRNTRWTRRTPHRVPTVWPRAGCAARSVWICMPWPRRGCGA